MERVIEALVRASLTAALMTGGGFAHRHLTMQAQQDAKGAMKMGISYSKFNRQLHSGGDKSHAVQLREKIDLK